MTQLSNRFYRALCLCAGERSIKQRLASAWIKHLDDIDAESLPAGVRAAFRSLQTAMHAVDPMPNEHPARAAARKLSVREATEYARSIATIYRETLRAELVPARTGADKRAVELQDDDLQPKSGLHLN